MEIIKKIGVTWALLIGVMASVLLFLLASAIPFLIITVFLDMISIGGFWWCIYQIYNVWSNKF